MLDGEIPDSIKYYLNYQYYYIEDTSLHIHHSRKYGNQIVIDLKMTEEGTTSFTYVVKVIYGIIQSMLKNPHLEESYNDLVEIYKKKFLYLSVDKYSIYLQRITFNILIQMRINSTFLIYSIWIILYQLIIKN